MEVIGAAAAAYPTVQAHCQTEASMITASTRRRPTCTAEAIRYLGSVVLKLGGLYPVARDSSLRLFEFDCVIDRGD